MIWMFIDWKADPCAHHTDLHILAVARHACFQFLSIIKYISQLIETP